MKGYYFALPRLAMQRTARDESNWLEINAVGCFIHLVVYCFAFHLFLSGRALWLQLLMLLPLAFCVWMFWLLLFYFDSLCLKLLRAIGIMRSLSDGRGQSVLIGTVTSCFAFSLLRDGRLFQAIGLAWLILVALNLVAAGFLANVSAAAK